MRYAGFIGSGYQTITPTISSDRLINGHLEIVEHGNARSPMVILGDPGKRHFATLPDAPLRALWPGEGRLLAVGGSTLYEVSSAGVPTVIGNVGPATTPAQIFSNGNQLFITSGNCGYLAPGAGVVYKVPAVTGTYIDGYFFAQEPNSNNFFISGFYDGATWSPLEFGVKEGDAARLRSLFAHRRVLYVNGATSYEAWQNTGNALFPWEYIQGSYTPVGIAGPHCITETERFRYWLGSSKVGPAGIWQEAGWGNPNRVSNHAIENTIQQYIRNGENVRDCVAVTKQHGGHYWVEFHFPSVNVVLGQPKGATWVYDETTSMQLGLAQWHEKAAWDVTHAEWLRDRAMVHAYVDLWGKHFVGDHTTGEIYEESLDLFDDAGQELRLLRSAPWIGREQDRLTFGPFILDMQVGGGTLYSTDPSPRIFPTPQIARSPRVCVQVSDDGGYTWSDEIWIDSGMLGQYTARAIFNRGGVSWNRTYRIMVSDPVRRCLTDAFLTVNGQ